MRDARDDRPQQGASMMLVDPRGRALLVQRAAGGLLDGTWAFPGGGIEPRDREAGRQLAPELAPEDAAARVAAVREVVEELGILPASPEPPPAPAALRTWRTRLVRGEADLAEALEGLDRTVDLHRVEPWTTARLEGFVVPPVHVHLHRVAIGKAGGAAPGRPEAEAGAPEAEAGAPVAEPSEEVADARWWEPAEALARWEEGKLALPEAIRRTLETASGRRPEEVEPGDGQELLRGLRLVPLRTPTLPPATHTNAFVLGSGPRRVVVDPGSPWAEGQAQLEGLRNRLGVVFDEVWLTHHHPDHVGGAAALKARHGLTVRAHPATAAHLPRGLVDAHLVDGEVRVLPGPRPQRWRALHTPGHAPGHLCLFEPDLRAVLVGDLMAGVGTVVVDPEEGDMALYLASLRRVRALMADFAFPSHGPPTAAVSERIDGYLAHRMEREAAILRAVRAGAPTPEEVVPQVYTDVPKALHPLAARSVLAHLLKLRDEGRLVETEGVWRPVD